MLARLLLLLDAKLNFRQTSRLHGVIMERIDPSYAAYLHQESLHPYSQYVLPADKGNTWWVIQTLSEEAYKNIICQILGGENSFILGHNDHIEVKILDRRVETLSKRELVQDFYNLPSKKIFSLQFITPTAFRQRKRYIILPDMRLMCQSLMMKYSLGSDAVDMMDEEALTQIADGSFITRHNLRSLLFPVEGQTLPGFVGNVTFRLNGTETMARYLRLLLSFGEFSGVGIKTSMGMGAIKVLG